MSAGGFNLGISGWRLHGQRTGIGRYILSIVERLSPEVIGGRFSKVVVYSPKPLDAEAVRLPPGIDNRVLRSRLPMLPWDNLRLGPFASDDVILYPSFSRPFLSRSATVVSTHDATMRIVPDLFTRRARLLYDPLYGWSARSATLVITTSHAAKRDIVREWDVDPAKIRVTPMAAAEDFYPLRKDHDKGSLRHELLGADLPYFLFVGKISGRRNVPELLRAFARFKTGGHPHKLVIVGPTYAMDMVKAIAPECGVHRDLITFSYVADEVLNKLYNGAEAFIMPSAYENGSLPVFEAQATGTPVIAVHTEGTDEITGGAALWIPQIEVDALVGAMNVIATDEMVRLDLSRRGLENSRRYSWERCATETLEVCREAAERHR